MDSERVCPECGHDVEEHTDLMCNAIVDVDGRKEYCECTISSGWCASIIERDEARNIARRMYRERNEIYRDLCAAENEIKRLRILILWADFSHTYINAGRISDGFGKSTFAWCSHCGGDMQVVRPGKFQCSECGK